VAKDPSSPVGRACVEGGIKRARMAMKSLTKAAKTGGLKFECDDCHKDDTTFELTDDARGKFKKLLVAAGTG
jgi:hypothetical protein